MTSVNSQVVLIARFADLGALAFAADAAVQAAGEHACTGHRGKEVESSTRAYRLAGQCGLRTPAVGAAAHPLPISGREREIAMLVAAGLSNRQTPIGCLLWLYRALLNSARVKYRACNISLPGQRRF